MDVCSNLSSEFTSEAYLEYRSRVFEQLAADYSKESKQTEKADNDFDAKPVSAPYSDDFLLQDDDFSLPEGSFKAAQDFQPVWDDSDLLEETYAFSSPGHASKPISPYDANRSNDLTSILQPDVICKPDNEPSVPEKPPMNWSSFNEHINQMSRKEKTLATVDDHNNMIPERWKGKKNAYQEQKLKREAIRRKLSLGELDEAEDDFGSDNTRYKADRGFSANSQSLHICYINEPCSSEESDNESSHPSPSFSPITSPSFTASRMLARKYARSHLPPDSPASPSSSNATAEHEKTVLGRLQGIASRKDSTADDAELEMRFELAQAHQRAKALADAAKQREKREHRSSLAHRLLSETLPADTASKMRSYSLTSSECWTMTPGQLQLILNDMHAKKQALNEELMQLLLKRDDLQTEQDGKLTDIEDIKSMRSAAGPETTV